MRKGRKLNKLKVGIVIFLVVLVISIAVFGRYIYNSALEAYFASKQFYFSSDILLLGGENDAYTYVSWGGVGEYEVGFDLYSYNNKLSKLEYDLDYTVTCQSLDERLSCSIVGTEGDTTTTGTINHTTNTSRINIMVKPTGDKIDEGETVSLLVTASTTEPYEKTISRKISFHINLPNGNSYTIDDEPGRDYAILKLVNLSTSDTEATLTFDPSKLRLDLNDELYTDSSYFVSKQTDGNGYINKIVFRVDAEGAKNVKFYKVDKTQDYSYLGSEGTSIIGVVY